MLGSEKVMVSDEANLGKSEILEFSNGKEDSTWLESNKELTMNLTQMNLKIFIEISDENDNDWTSLTNLQRFF